MPTAVKVNSAPHALNSYTWKLIEANLGWKKTSDGLVPIIPVAQQPEMMEAGNPFIVYSSSRPTPGHLYALERQMVVYRLFSDSSTTANNVAELLFKAFARQDEAAADVNEHLDAEVEKGGRAKRRPVYFSSIKSYALQDEEPAETEGGYASTSVVVEMTFTADDSDIQTSGFTY